MPSHTNKRGPQVNKMMPNCLFLNRLLIGRFFVPMILSFQIGLLHAEAPSVAAPPKLTDEQLMDVVQRQTFKYFWDFGHPVSGLVREQDTFPERCAIGGSGFGAMSIMVGVKRGYITREEGAARLLKMTRFLRDKTTRYHGAWSHWVHGVTGKTLQFGDTDDGGDIVETAFLIQGLLAARDAFSSSDPVEMELREVITRLWEDVEWDWYARGGDQVHWHWSPTHEWGMNHQVRGYNECMIVYLLGAASPTHPLPATAYDNGWAGPEYVKRLQLQWPYGTGGPLFLTHYSFLGMTPHFADAYVSKASFPSYFERGREQTLINRRFCVSRQNVFPDYNENCWGLTASRDPDKGYDVHLPWAKKDNGTIAPTAAISSIIYTPVESLAAMRFFYEVYGPQGLWGEYGFKDAFNPGRKWICDRYLAIDQGPILIMIENHRSGLLWKHFMGDPDIRQMITKLNLKLTR